MKLVRASSLLLLVTSSASSSQKPTTHLASPHTYMEHKAPAQAQATDVDVVIRDLKSHPGFAAYMILNNDGEREQQQQEQRPAPL